MESKNTNRTLVTVLIGFVGSLFLRLLYLTFRRQPLLVVDGPLPEPLPDQPLIFVFWHNRQLCMPWMKRGVLDDNRKIYTLISAHQDGRLIAECVSWLGIDNVPGSSTRLGRGASRQLVKLIRSGSHVVITPDGPRGPLYVCKVGVIKLAQLTGAPIYPIAFSASSSWAFSSWDKMILPKPFSKIRYALTHPIRVPQGELTDAEVEEYRVKVEEGLCRVTEEVDASFHSW